MADRSITEPGLGRAWARGPWRRTVALLLPLVLAIAASGALHLTGADRAAMHAAVRLIEIRPFPAQPAFLQMPELVVPVHAPGPAPRYLRARISVELGSRRDAAAVEQVLPRVVDTLNIYLRELRVEELRGTMGLQRLREELLRRINALVHPVEVRNVLFHDLLVQ